MSDDMSTTTNTSRQPESKSEDKTDEDMSTTTTSRQPEDKTGKTDQQKTDEDSGITMVDVLEEEKELEEDANAVLGGSDDQNCTYSQQVTVTRQALYACKTCASDGKELAGICLACSYACHEGHDLFELYTKRNFCCDCGNGKFPAGNPCKLYPNKASFNGRNSYNQNFRGVYCICSRPYPDPEVEFEDEMIQCIVCEDWYHGRHLGTAVPDEHDYGEMICGECMVRSEFLWPYAVAHSVVAKTEAKEEIVDVGELGDDDEKIVTATGGVAASAIVDCEENRNQTVKNSCLLEALKGKGGELVPITKATFWPDGWRKKLCTCDSCKELYQRNNKSYLLEAQDTVHAYEEEGKAKQSGQSQYDKGMEALSSMDRVRQVEAIHEYNSMKTQLKNYLKSFAETKKVVRKEDIDEFFSQMKSRKRRRVDVPDFCR